MDRLYLLSPEFSDADLPGRTFYCRHCMLLDGLFAAFPERLETLEIVRVDHPRPRRAVIEAVGEAHQSLPLLVLDDEGPRDFPTQAYGDVRFVDDFGTLLHVLHVRHGLPEAHP